MLAAARSRRAGLARGHSRTGWLLQARSLHIEGAVNPATHTLSRDPPASPAAGRDGAGRPWAEGASADLSCLNTIPPP